MWFVPLLRRAAAPVTSSGSLLLAVILLFAAHPAPLHAQEPLCPSCGPLFTIYGSPTNVYQTPGATNQTATFVVDNQNAWGVSVTLSCTVQAPVQSCGSVTPSSVYVNPQSQQNVTVQYNVAGTTGTGNVFLTGYHDDEETPNPQYAYVQVNVQGPVAPGIVLRNRPDQLERGLCLTAGAGEAAWQCGDLLVAHGMPGYRTLGRDRALTLVYNSATAAPRPTVAVNVTQPWGAQTPDSVYAELRVGAHGGTQTVRASATYQGWAPGPVTKQVVLSYDASSDGTGVYDYTLLVRNKYGSGPQDTTLTGQLIVVNRASSRYGRGWELAGVEWIQYYAGGASWPNGKMLWVGGDGSARIYTPVGGDTTAWRAPAGGFRDRIDLVGGVYTRRLRHGVQVQYNGYGRHIATINRVGQQTTFSWDATYPDVLRSITVPPSGAGLTYQVNYPGYHVGSLVDPGARALTLTVTSGQLTSLLDPDNISVAFGYDGSGRITSRTNRKGHATRYEYGNGLRVTKSHVPYGATGADTARTTYDAWDERGLFIGTGGSGLAAVDSFQIRTRIDGPRTDVSDTAAFYVDTWGAPVRTVNALGAVTQIKRQSAIYPALVTEMVYPNNRIVRMTYDTTVGRGNLKMVRDSTLHLTSGLPTKATTYTYGSGVAPDSPTQVADVLGRTTTYAYNGMGILGSSTDPRGHVTQFLYDSTGGSPTRGVIRSVTEKSVQTWEEQAGTGDDTLTTDTPRDHVTRYGYDDQGNIDSVAAPHGVVTTYDNDTFGRTYRSWDALNMMTELTFDPLNRIIQQRQDTVPQANPFSITLASMACDATQVECADTTTRGFTTGFPRYADTYFRQGPVGVDSVTGPLGATRRYVYDARAALEREKDELQAAQIVIPNPAGLTLKTISRTNDTVFYAYDALGRTTAQWFKSRTMHSQSIPGDSTSYTYDVMNNVLEAKNSQGTITRTYYADGSVKSRIQTFPISGNDTLRYEYNATGQRSKLIHGPDTVTYTYSGTTGDLTTMQVKWGAPANVTRTLSFTWDALGRRRQVTYPNGMVVEYRYDKLGTLRRIKSRHPGTPPNGNNLHFTYIADAVDAHGRLLHQKSMCKASGGTPLGHSLCEGATLGPETVNRYNRFGAMVSSQVDGNADSLEYDAAGNMTRRRLAGSIHWHTYMMTANTNRLASDASTGSSTLSFTYDANGARTLEDHAGGVQHPWKEYYYDGLGRTTGVKYWADVQPFGVQPAGGSDQCRYDADGQMIKPCDNWSSFLAYDGANVVGVPGLSNGTRATFVHGPGLDDPLLGVVRFQSDAKEVMWVTDGAGRQYAVGGVDGHDPASIAPNIDFSGSSGYWGWQWVGGTKRSYGFSARRQSPAGSAGAFSVFRNRLYDPATGRWTQEDPIGVAGGVNLYQFNANNPAAYTDPFGLCPPPESCKLLTAAGVAALADTPLPGPGDVVAAGLVVAAAGVTLYAAKDKIAAGWTKLITIAATIGSVVAGSAGATDASTQAPDGIAAPAAEAPAPAKPKKEKPDTATKPPEKE